MVKIIFKKGDGEVGILTPTMALSLQETIDKDVPKGAPYYIENNDENVPAFDPAVKGHGAARKAYFDTIDFTKQKKSKGEKPTKEERQTERASADNPNNKEPEPESAE